MKKYFSLIAAFMLLLTPFLSFKKEAVAGVDTLRIYNWEDYIYKNLNDDGEVISSWEDDFKVWYKAEYKTDIKVEYSTFGTNEIMYNELKINKNSYDLVCPSDYMIQKMINESMCEPISEGGIKNFETFGSGFFKDMFKKEGWDKYSIGYMWGTLGYVYNPKYVSSSDISSWSAIWNIDYKQKSTLKDSVRDTYFLGVAYVYRDELNAKAKQLEEYKIQNKFGQITNEQLANYEKQYSEELDVIFNRTDDETIAKVKTVLTSVKDNIFSFEVDDGKNDMVTGKVNINFAWSGDAAYAINEAKDKDNVELYYSIPKEGSNIWYDGWVMPKGANTVLAERFLNWVSLPEIAIKNMEYIGYTSAVAGDEVFNWVKKSYAPAKDAKTTYDVDLSYFFTNLTKDTSATVTTDTIGRAFSAQYPDKETILRCAVMKYFDDATNAKINAMWESVKGHAMPVWAIILIVVGCVLLVGGVILAIFIKKNGGISRGDKKQKKNWTVVKKG